MKEKNFAVTNNIRQSIGNQSTRWLSSSLATLNISYTQPPFSSSWAKSPRTKGRPSRNGRPLNSIVSYRAGMDLSFLRTTLLFRIRYGNLEFRDSKWELPHSPPHLRWINDTGRNNNGVYRSSWAGIWHWVRLCAGPRALFLFTRDDEEINKKTGGSFSQPGRSARCCYYRSTISQRSRDYAHRSALTTTDSCFFHRRQIT